MTSWPDNPNLLVVAERGSAKVVLRDITPPPDPSSLPPGQSGAVPQPVHPLLDLSGIADVPNPNSGWTQQFGGLTGFAFHPRFAQGRRYRYIFVRYNIGIPPAMPLDQVRVVIERYAVAPGLQGADPASRTTIFDEVFFTNGQGGHFSGALHFDPRTFYDGTGTTQDDEVYHLFAPMGDMVEAVSPMCDELQYAWALVLPTAQIQSIYTGKLLRFEIGPGVLPSGTSVPPVTPVILGRGLRNPYAFSLDRGETDETDRGDMWICYTGSRQPNPPGVPGSGPRPGEIVRLSEAETSAPGCGVGGGTCRDFGWPWVETVILQGTTITANVQAVCWGSGLRPSSIIFVTDVAEADLAVNPARGDAVLGGIVYRGSKLNQVDYAGRLFYGTFANTSSPALIAADRDNLRDPNSDTVVPPVDVMGNDPFGPPSTGAADYKLVGFGEDTDGEIYLIRMDTQKNSTLNNGTIFRLDPQ